MGVITSCYLWIMTAAVPYGTPPVLKQKNKNSPKSDKEVKRPERKITNQKLPKLYVSNESTTPSNLPQDARRTLVACVGGRAVLAKTTPGEPGKLSFLDAWRVAGRGKFPFLHKGSSVLSCGNRDTTLIY